jgi:hypothetical protein
VILVSKDYVKKRWPRHEFHAVQARVFEQFDQAYMLPIRIDNADLQGLLSTVGHLSLKSMSIQEAAIIIRETIKGTARINAITRSADVAFRKGDYPLRERISAFLAWPLTGLGRISRSGPLPA